MGSDKRGNDRGNDAAVAIADGRNSMTDATDVPGIPRLGAQSHPVCPGHTADPCVVTSYADLVTVAAYKLGIQAVRIRSL